MIISSRGRYALRIMIDLVQNDKGMAISLKDVAERQHISVKYSETIASMLQKAGLISSQRGKSGGYRVTKPADECSVGEIILAVEGDIAPVSCVSEDAEVCEEAGDCLLLPLFVKLDDMIEEYLNTITIADILRTKE